MFSKQGRLAALVGFLLVTVFSAWGLSRLAFDFNFEAFLPDDDPDIAYYTDFKSQFSEGSNVIVAGLENSSGTFDPDFLKRVRRFTVCARRLPLVEDAYSLLTLKDYLYDPLQPQSFRILKSQSEEGRSADSLRIMTDPRFKGTLISYDGSMLLVNLSTTADRTQSEEDGLVQSLNDLLLEFGFQDAAVIGYPVLHHELRQYQTSEFAFYTGIGTLVMLFCMTLLFRRFWGTVVAFLSVVLGMVIFFGILGWIGRPIDLMGTLFPILIVIVGTSDVVHIMTKYVDELRLGKGKKEALLITFKEIGLATLLTSLTTAIGFLSLYASNMPPIRNFGIMAAVGVFVAFGTVILLTTAMVSWFPAEAIMKSRKGKRPMSRFLNGVDNFTRQKPGRIALGAVLFIGVCVWGSSKTTLSLTNKRDLPMGTKLLHDFNTIDEKTKGINPIDLAIELKGERTFYDISVQREIDRFESYLRSNPVYGPISSPLMIFRLMNMAWKGPYPENYTLAATQAEFDRQLDFGKKYLEEPLRGLLSEDGKAAWMFAKVTDLGSHELRSLKQDMEEQFGDNPIFKFTPTGPRHIFDKHQELLVFSLLKSLGLAMILVSLFMALVFRDWRMVLVSLIPNIVPLIATAGIIGFLGFQLDPKVAIVFTVAFGIAVDDSIHFLSRYKLERDKGFSQDKALHNTFMETGRAIVVTTLILFFGFGTLVFSVFPPTFTIGLLLALTLLIALIGDFLLLPISIRWLIPEKAIKEAEKTLK